MDYNFKKFKFKYIISSSEQQNIYLLPKKKSLIILEFWNEQCTHCGHQESLLEQIRDATENDSLAIYKVDIEYDLNLEFSRDFTITQLPSLLFLNMKRKRAFFFSGVTNKEVIQYFISNIKKKKCCINCKKCVPLKKKGNLFFCKKKKDYVSYKDFC